MATKAMLARKRREKAQEQSKERRAKRISEGKSVIGGGLDGNKDTYGYLFNRPPKKKKAEAKAPAKKKVTTKTNVSEGTAKVGGTKKKPNFTAMANPTKGKNPKGLSSADLEASIPKKSMPKSSGTAVSQNADKIVKGEVAAGNRADNAELVAKSKPSTPNAMRASIMGGRKPPPGSSSDSDSGAGVSGQEGMNAGARRRKDRATPAFKHGGKVRGAGIAKQGVRKCKMR
tara:strand:+ start:201 stop:890 length:690 start_codon:yes stop_codon:yes gene_type:complete